MEHIKSKPIMVVFPVRRLIRYTTQKDYRFICAEPTLVEQDNRVALLEPSIIEAFILCDDTSRKVVGYHDGTNTVYPLKSANLQALYHLHYVITAENIVIKNALDKAKSINKEKDFYELCGVIVKAGLKLEYKRQRIGRGTEWEMNSFHEGHFMADIIGKELGKHQRLKRIHEILDETVLYDNDSYVFVATLASIAKKLVPLGVLDIWCENGEIF